MMEREKNRERGKSEESPKRKSPSLFSLLAPSILSICLSIICLCGLTWAWFADSVTYNFGKIESGSVSLAVSYAVSQNQEDTGTQETEIFYEIPEGENGFLLSVDRNQSYHVQVVNKGSVNGYITIIAKDKQYIAPVYRSTGMDTQVLDFGIMCVAEESVEVQIKSFWGDLTSRSDLENYILLSDVAGDVELALPKKDVSGSDAVMKDAIAKELSKTEGEAMQTAVEPMDVSAGDVSGNDVKTFGYPVIVID